MKMTARELARRLEEAARIRVVLRRATLELKSLGEAVLQERARGSRRSQRRRAPLR